MIPIGENRFDPFICKISSRFFAIFFRQTIPKNQVFGKGRKIVMSQTDRDF